MEINDATQIASATKRNILLGIIDKNTTKNAVATRAGISLNTFNRRLEHPEQFTFRELGSIASVLEVQLAELIKDAA